MCKDNMSGVNIFSEYDAYVESKSDADFEEQTTTRKKQLLKNTINMMSAVTGIFVIRLSMTEISRLLSDKTDDADPLKVALQNLDSIFSDCSSKLGGDSALQSSLESIQRNIHERQKDFAFMCVSRIRSKASC